ncbi:MAG: hypothetical protein GY863_17590 [bacterium]|nr:hypothetical protein [bacterium]
MKIRKFKTTVIMLTVVLLMINAGYTQEIDYQRMERDIKIQEDILKNLISDRVVKDFYSEEYFKGVYLDNFGVVFMVPLSSHTISGDGAQSAKERHEGMKDNFVEFFSSYADVIGQVRPTDTISIIATPSSRFSTSVYFVDRTDANYVLSSRSREEFKVSPFIMSVKKSDIARYRDGSLNDAQFKNVVTYTEIGNKNKDYISEDFMKDIKILRGVMQVTVNDNFSSGISQSGFQGTYIKDYGVFFTVNGGNSVAVPVPMIVDGQTGGFVFDTRKTDTREFVADNAPVTVIELQNALHEEDERLALTYRDFSSYGFKGSNEKLLSTIIDSITDALGNYGHTLKEMKPDEKISILYTSRGERMSRRANKSLMLTVAYRDILAYSRGSIDFNAFKTKVLARTY